MILSNLLETFDSRQFRANIEKGQDEILSYISRLAAGILLVPESLCRLQGP